MFAPDYKHIPAFFSRGSLAPSPLPQDPSCARGSFLWEALSPPATYSSDLAPYNAALAPILPRP